MKRRAKTRHLPFSIECTQCEGTASGDGVGSRKRARRMGWTKIRPTDESPTSNFYGRCPMHTTAARLSGPMTRVVMNLSSGHHWAAHARNCSQRGALSTALTALLNRKIIARPRGAGTDNYYLTDFGKQIAEAIND